MKNELVERAVIFTANIFFHFIYTTKETEA